MAELDALRPGIPLKRIIFSEDQIKQRVNQLADEINDNYKNKELVSDNSCCSCYDEHMRCYNGGVSWCSEGSFSVLG